MIRRSDGGHYESVVRALKHRAYEADAVEGEYQKGDLKKLAFLQLEHDIQIVCAFKGAEGILPSDIFTKLMEVIPYTDKRFSDYSSRNIKFAEGVQFTDINQVYIVFKVHPDDLKATDNKSYVGTTYTTLMNAIAQKSIVTVGGMNYIKKISSVVLQISNFADIIIREAPLYMLNPDDRGNIKFNVAFDVSRKTLRAVPLGSKGGFRKSQEGMDLESNPIPITGNFDALPAIKKYCEALFNAISYVNYLGDDKDAIKQLNIMNRTKRGITLADHVKTDLSESAVDALNFIMDSLSKNKEVQVSREFTKGLDHFQRIQETTSDLTFDIINDGGELINKVTLTKEDDGSYKRGTCWNFFNAYYGKYNKTLIEQSLADRMADYNHTTNRKVGMWQLFQEIIFRKGDTSNARKPQGGNSGVVDNKNTRQRDIKTTPLYKTLLLTLTDSLLKKSELSEAINYCNLTVTAEHRVSMLKNAKTLSQFQGDDLVEIMYALHHEPLIYVCSRDANGKLTCKPHGVQSTNQKASPKQGELFVIQRSVTDILDANGNVLVPALPTDIIKTMEGFLYSVWSESSYYAGATNTWHNNLKKYTLHRAESNLPDMFRSEKFKNSMSTGTGLTKRLNQLAEHDIEEYEAIVSIARALEGMIDTDNNPTSVSQNSTAHMPSLSSQNETAKDWADLTGGPYLIRNKSNGIVWAITSYFVLKNDIRDALDQFNSTHENPIITHESKRARIARALNRVNESIADLKVIHKYRNR